ncbi:MULTISPECIES: hypothetical protein [unclassified Sphingomonas]|uniref:hypothetical protein n=1 Tax=unclassified Sphingomonas TaxID=196159 RepID=UPI00226A7737|nr:MULTISPECIES: hypothetical protein [unclassified Sphingomonas]
MAQWLAQPNPRGCIDGQGRTQVPFQQGQLDGLCSIYSAINAVSLLLGRNRMSQRKADRLFRAGLATAMECMPPEELVASGIPPAIWLPIVRRICREATRGSPVAITSSRPTQRVHEGNFGQVRSIVEAALNRGAVVLIWLDGHHDHYTVVRGHTRSRFLLHDSAGLQWLNKKHCGLAPGNQRHRIDSYWVIALERLWVGYPRSNAPGDDQADWGQNH